MVKDVKVNAWICIAPRREHT